MNPETGRSSDRFTQWDAWLKRQPEPALDPRLPFVDAHHHLWDRGGHCYLPRQFLDDASALNLTASVYVECQSGYHETGQDALKPVGETASVATLVRDMTPHAGDGDAPAVCAGIVGYADMSLGDRIDEVLDAHEAAGEGRFRGVRLTVAWDEDPGIHGSRPTQPGMLADASILRAAQRLMRRHLSLDLWIYFHQLREVVAFARDCPDLTIIVNHCGGPLGLGVHAGQREAVFVRWQAGIDALRSCGNVVMKFGGMAMPLAGFLWRKQVTPPSSEELAVAWRPYFDACMEAFGPRRLMFESNFPVDRTGCTYTSLWNAYLRLSASSSASERAAMFAENAARIYRLSSHHPDVSRDPA